jgi:hypothetical protein
MMDAMVLKGELKPALIAFWETTDQGDAGMSIEEYADKFSQIIAEKVVAHITANALVSTTVTGTAGPYPVAAAGTGSVS